MPRSLRIEYPGAFYHVMARGNRREGIFRDEEDRRYFLKTLSQACERTGWRVHSWVLMGNHYHILLETPEANLVAGMKWLQNTYTRRFNTRHRLWGRLFGDRYKAVLVDGKTNYYYNTLVDYIHLNPVRVGLIRVSEGTSIREYLWSSAAGYASIPKMRPKWLAAADGLAAVGFADTASGRRGYIKHLDQRALERGIRNAGIVPPEGDRRASHLRHGWYWGSQAFAERMLKIAEKLRPGRLNRTYRAGALSKAHDERQAESLLQKGLEAAGLGPEDLKRLRGSEPRKVAIASLLLDKTIATQSWIAEHLKMRTAANVSQQVLRYRREQRPLPHKLQAYLQAVKIC